MSEVCKYFKEGVCICKNAPTGLTLIAVKIYNNFYCNSCREPLNKALDNIDVKKLKPVDENCLYKPVKILHGDVFGNDCLLSPEANAGILVSIDYKDESDVNEPVPYIVVVKIPIDEQIKYFKEQGFNSTRQVVYSRKVERIPDYDYGDGGNYE